MVILQNGCRRSEINVYPANWKTVKASTKVNWYISYRFYDPLSKKYPNGKLIIAKGMNVFKVLQERKQATLEIIEYQTNLLDNLGYNPLTGQRNSLELEVYEIDPSTPIIEALRLASDRLQCEQATKLDIRSVLKYFEMSAIQLRYTNIPIYEVRKKHVRMILDNCKNLTTEDKEGKTIPKKWSANQFNHYRKYLSALFAELSELEAIETNIIRDIAKRTTIKSIRQTLKPEERKRIDEFLSQNYYPFWRFVNIFFHSGSRITELLKIKKEDVDIDTQQFKVTIIKGKQRREAMKTIKNIALPIWNELMRDAKPGDFIFGKGLEPNIIKTTSHQITRRWKVHVKDKLQIEADIYSLKHLNTSETVDQLNDADAAKMNSHTSTAMVVGIYDVKRGDRQHDRLKKVNNSFV